MLSRWLMANDFQPLRGHTFRFATGRLLAWRLTIRCQVVELDEPARLSYTWDSTTVTWTLQRVPGGTRLRVEHTGFVGVRGFCARLILAQIWRRKLTKKLRAILARIPE